MIEKDSKQNIEETHGFLKNGTLQFVSQCQRKLPNGQHINGRNDTKSLYLDSPSEVLGIFGGNSSETQPSRPKPQTLDSLRNP